MCVCVCCCTLILRNSTFSWINLKWCRIYYLGIGKTSLPGIVSSVWAELPRSCFESVKLYLKWLQCGPVFSGGRATTDSLVLTGMFVQGPADFWLTRVVTMLGMSSRAQVGESCSTYSSKQSLLLRVSKSQKCLMRVRSRISAGPHLLGM